MDVRPAVPHDRDQICALIQELAVYEHLEHEVDLTPADVDEHVFGPSPSAWVLMAQDGDEVIGFALYFPTFSSFLGRPGIWLEDLFVRPEHRGRGAGKALLDGLRDRTGGRVEWAVLDWNTPSIEFYDALGAEPVAGWTRYRWLPDG
jgi:GNAT superfamily N-acetyltransferase